MNSFNMAVTIATVGMLMLLWGAGKWNKYQDKNQQDKKRKKISNKFKQM